MKLHCVGCGVDIAWNGMGTLCYTCPCGSTIFSDGQTSFALPASLATSFFMKRKYERHLDFLVGNSSYTSPEKEGVIELLREMGMVWMKECEKCQKDGTLEKHNARLEYTHLAAGVSARVRCNELNLREASDEMKLLQERFFAK